MEKDASFDFVNDPKFVAKQIREILYVMIGRLKMESREKSLFNLKNKIHEMNVSELANKKAPGGAAIGTSLSLIKNILNGKDPYFIKTVLIELENNL